MDQNVYVLWEPLDRDVNCAGRSSDFGVFGGGKIGLVDLNMFASGRDQTRKVLVQQLANVVHHPRHIVVVFVIRDSCQKMRSGHRDFDRLARKARYHPEFVDQAEIGRVVDRRTANCGWMEDVRVVPADRFWPGDALERRYLLPKIVQHRIWRRMAIMGSPMHLAARDHIDAGGLLF